MLTHSWRLFVRVILFPTVILLFLFFGIFVVVYVSLHTSWPEWTGFDRSIITARIITTNIPQVPPELFIEYYQPEKTLWDWLGLLIVPSVLAFGAVYLNWQQRQNELEIAQKERQNELEIAEKRAQDALLQTYLDQMTDLLLAGKLRESQIGAEVRQVAQTRTLIALRRLDCERRVILMQFLRASKLIGMREDRTLVNIHGNILGNYEYIIIDFRGVDLSNANLSSIPLFFINLSHTNLSGANLEGANLEGVNLQGANLQGANLQGAYLNRANVRSALLQGANLEGTKFLSADLAGTNLSKANLSSANLIGACLTGVNFTEANLQRAHLGGANLRVTVFAGANLEGANLQGTNLVETNLAGANLTGVDFREATVTPQQLAQAASLKGATMPDGSIHNEHH